MEKIIEPCFCYN